MRMDTAPLIPLEIRTRIAPCPVVPELGDFRWVVNNEHGTMLLGGEYTPQQVLGAYRVGLFPWPNQPGDRIWFTSDPRAVLEPRGLHVSRRLARTLRQGAFTATVDAAFETVIASCAHQRPDGTWITPELMECYIELHHLGWAHSFETWTREGDLAGGLYGIAIGGLFGAESMFHAVTDASKAAMAAMMQHVRSIGVELIDLQVITDHTARMGATEISQMAYLQRLDHAIDLPVSWPLAEPEMS